MASNAFKGKEGEIGYALNKEKKNHGFTMAS